MSSRTARTASNDGTGMSADRGAAAVTSILTALLLLAVLLPAVVTVGDLLGTARRAAGAADAAALAALAGSALAGGAGVPDIATAEAVARANGARLVAVDDEGWPLRVGVTVSARPHGRVGDLVGDLPAAAAARLVPPHGGAP